MVKSRRGIAPASGRDGLIRTIDGGRLMGDPSPYQRAGQFFSCCGKDKVGLGETGHANDGDGVVVIKMDDGGTIILGYLPIR